MSEENIGAAAEAIAEISFENGWNLPHAGTAPFRYWAHVCFGNDSKENLWTLFIELEQPPEEQKKVYLAKIFFLSPKAPISLFKLGQKFQLSIGPMAKARGVVKNFTSNYDG